MTLSRYHVVLLRRVFIDERFARTRAVASSLHFASRTLREHYAMFVWDFGDPLLLHYTDT